jgi:GNAT superfamily N-acetyltransferase
MHVVDLAAEHRDLFALCLEDWSADAREAGTRRAQWVERFTARGLRAKLALDDQGTPGGMIQYLPIEQSMVRGAGLYFVNCIWVHGHRQGRGNFQGRGMGQALLTAAETDARERGATGMAAWGLWLPFWMKASWFKRHGYRKADRQGVAVLLWKPFSGDAEPPRWHPKGPELPDPEPNRVNVTAFVNGWCTAMNLAAERMRRAATEFGDQVSYREIDTSEPSAVAQWGRCDALFIDGKAVRTGPPPTYERLRVALQQRVRRLRRVP